MTVRELTRITSRGAVVLACAFSACSSSGPRADSDWGRPGDGVLSDPALQAVVDAQGRRDAAALESYLASDDAAVRARAAFALGSVQELGARPLLLELLDDPNPRVRADAAFAIGQLPDTSGTRALVDRLRQEDDDATRLQLIQATGRAGGRGAAALLLRTDIRESELPMLGLALARLGNRGVNNAVAVELLIDLMQHAHPTVRRNAAFYFGRSASPAFWSPVVPRLRERLETLDRGDAAALWLLRALAKMDQPQDTEPAISWLADATDWRIRHAAADLLQDRQTDGAVTLALMAALGDPSVHVREAAARGVASRSRRLSDDDHFFLDTWIGEHPDDLSTIAALLPTRVRKDPYAVLEWGDRYPAESAQRAAALEALGILPGLDIVEREFAAAAGGGPTAAVGLTALEARIPAANRERLSRIFDVAVDAVASGLSTKVQLGSVLLANPRIVPLGSVRAIEEALDRNPSEHIARTLHRTLVATEDPATIPLLEAGLLSDDPEIRAVAAVGLTALTGVAPSYDPLPRPVPPVDWDRAREYGRHPRLRFGTRYGEITVELDAEQAPLTTQTFLGLVERGDLDGVPFHRVVPAFVIQGGDVTSGDGFGVAPTTIRSEFTRTGFDQGTLGMASSGKDTEGSQFFITHLMTPHLDGAYTAFGRVVSGQGVVDQMSGNDALVSATLVPGSGT